MKSIKLIIVFLIYCLQVFPQSDVFVGKPKLLFQNDTLVILFDIGNCSNDAVFIIEPKITLVSGNILNINSLSGDLGDSISCGKNKKIIWSLASDGIQIDDEIEVQIFAEEVINNISESDIKDKPSEFKNKEDSATKHANLRSAGYSRANIIASSVFVPGLGQKKASGKSGHLVLSVLGYGSLASSAYFLIKSSEEYDLYLETENRIERDIRFTESEKYYNLGKYFIYGAAGIWAANILWSTIAPVRSNLDFTGGVSANPYGGIQLYAIWNF